jgi:hypothetical protein
MSLLISPGVQRSSLGSFLGGAIGAIGGLVTGGPGGVVAGAQAGAKIGNALTGGGGQTPPTGNLPGKAFGGFSFGPELPGGSSGGMANGAPCATGTGLMGIWNSMTGQCTTCTKGYHLNRSVLAPTRGHCGQGARSSFVGKGTTLVRNRRMHPLNSKAARRAVRRLHAAHRMFSKIDRLVGQHRRKRA